MEKAIIVNERILGFLLFNLFSIFSYIVYLFGNRNLIEIGQFLLTKINSTDIDVSYYVIKNNGWLYGEIINYVNILIKYIVHFIVWIKLTTMMIIDILLMMFNYSILGTIIFLMIMGTFVTFLSMKIYRSNIYISLFYIKITN